MKNYKIIFCWAEKFPIILKYNNEVLIKAKHEIIIKAESVSDVMTKLKGTNPKTISNIKNIIEC